MGSLKNEILISATGLRGSCAAAYVEQDFHLQSHSARKTKGPTKGPLIFLAEKAGFTLRLRRRVLKCGCAAA